MSLLLLFGGAASGVTYNKVGAVVADTVLGGTDVFEAVETAVVVADTVMPGTDVREAVELGTVVSDTTTTGPDVFTAAETGTTASGAVAAGAGAWESVESGATVADTALTGDQALTLNRAGTTVADTATLAADVFEAVETGAAVADTAAAGFDSLELPSAGAAVAGTAATGADVFEAVETGTAKSQAFEAGFAAKEGAGKTGEAKAGTVSAGGDVHEAVRTGVASPATRALAADVFEAVEVGVVTTRASVAGADVFTASETGTVVTDTEATGGQESVRNRAGTAASGAKATGADVFEANEAGTATSAARAAGTDVFEAVETGTVKTGALARGTGQAGFFSKLGTVASQALSAAQDAFTAAETGTLVSGVVGSALDVYTAARTGVVNAAARLFGTSEEVAPQTHEKTGTVAAGTRLAGLSEYQSSIPQGAVEGDTTSGSVVESGHGALAAGPDYAAAILATAGLVGYWRLGEAAGTAANDEVGSNDGTYDSGVTLGTAGALAGDADTAATFDGTAAAKIAFGDPNLAAPFSLEAWVFCTGPGSAGATDFSTIFGYAGGKRLLLRNGVGFRYIMAQIDGSTSLFTPVDSAPLNTWLYVVYTYGDAPATERIYINGVERANVANAGGPAWTLPFWVGAFGAPSINYSFKGRIDEPAIYNVALSPATVLEHYEAGTAAGDAFPVESDAATGSVVEGESVLVGLVE